MKWRYIIIIMVAGRAAPVSLATLAQFSGTNGDIYYVQQSDQAIFSQRPDGTNRRKSTPCHPT